MTRAVLRFFGRFQRVVAWTILVGGVVSFLAVFFNIIRTGDAKFGTLLVAFLVWNDGFQSVQAVENELGSEAAADDAP